eukprot:21085-Heterococcus_DN1.PRE.1
MYDELLRDCVTAETPTVPPQTTNTAAIAACYVYCMHSQTAVEKMVHQCNATTASGRGRAHCATTQE